MLLFACKHIRLLGSSNVLLAAASRQVLAGLHLGSCTCGLVVPRPALAHARALFAILARCCWHAAVGASQGGAKAYNTVPVNGWLWWAYNENSGDTGGIVMNQWQELNWEKINWMVARLGLRPWYMR
jgi:hypothetical protein